jgi:hypothetical protein
MEKLLNKLELIKIRQNDLMEVMAKEKCQDIHSVLRLKDLAESIIELEIRKKVLMDAIAAII